MSSIDPDRPSALEPTGWLPMLHLGGDSWAGVVEPEEVFVGSHESPVRRVDWNTPTGLLPLLERPLAVVRAEIDDWRESHGAVLGPSAQIIPLDAVVVHALTSGSEYWAGLAVEWADAMPEAHGITEALDALAVARWASQPLRHRARRIRRCRGG